MLEKWRKLDVEDMEDIEFEGKWRIKNFWRTAGKHRKRTTRRK